jgi:hypothetical protein
LHAWPAGPYPALVRLDRRTLAAAGGGGLLLLLLAAGTLGLVRWWRAPAPVPDHAAPLVATNTLLFAGGNGLGQRVTPTRDGLRAVDLIVVAEAPALPGEVELRVLDWPSGQELGGAHRRAADAPAGNPWDFRPGQAAEQWLTFGFEPIPDSAGRDLQLVVSYPEGRDTPGARLATLANFPAHYPLGELRVNGDRAGGNLLFRLATAGRRGDAVRQAGDNLARGQPLGAGGLVLPATLAVLALASLTGLVAAVRLAPDPAPGEGAISP